MWLVLLPRKQGSPVAAPGVGPGACGKQHSWSRVPHRGSCDPRVSRKLTACPLELVFGCLPDGRCRGPGGQSAVPREAENLDDCGYRPSQARERLALQPQLPQCPLQLPAQGVLYISGSPPEDTSHPFPQPSPTAEAWQVRRGSTVQPWCEAEVMEQIHSPGLLVAEEAESCRVRRSPPGSTECGRRLWWTPGGRVPPARMLIRVLL